MTSIQGLNDASNSDSSWFTFESTVSLFHLSNPIIAAICFVAKVTLLNEFTISTAQPQVPWSFPSLLNCFNLINSCNDVLAATFNSSCNKDKSPRTFSLSSSERSLQIAVISFRWV
eukprot:NODE_210_length_14612_cov_0.470957.p8 type:complete len:116 gc:universal NODE_210_length_14612_cov_0.470957:9310-9657(+)